MAGNADALNFPYIRIRDVDWLKRTLLFFPHVVRITPDRADVGDDAEVDRFCWLEGHGGLPLLRRADLRTEGVDQAQMELMSRIASRLNDDPSFAARFRRDPTPQRRQDRVRSADQVWKSRDAEEPFQLHGSKMAHELRGYLVNEGLAWIPDRPHGPGYVEMERPLGEAVMATIAYACAADEGLELVTEFPELFARTIHQPRDGIFEACIGEPPKADHHPAEEFAEFVIHQCCDVSKLTPERIQALSKEWDAVAAFKAALQEASKSLPEIMNDKTRREERLRDAAGDVLRRWRQDKANLSAFARELFGESASDAPEKLLEKVADSAFGHATVSGAIVGEVTGQFIAGATVGLAIGVVLKAVRNVRRRERESPFRYLTLLEKSGTGIVLSH